MSRRLADPAAAPELALHSEPVLAVRREALRALLLAATAGAAVVLVVGAAGGLRSRLFPWDGLILLAVSLISAALVFPAPPSSQRLAHVAAWFLALASQPLLYATQAYGVRSPVNALYLLSALVAALLVGRGFVSWWTAFLALWIGITGWGQLTGRWAVTEPPLAAGELAVYLAFWWGLLLAGGGLAWYLARLMERALQVAYGQTASLAQIGRALAAEPDVERLLGQVLAAIAQQLQAECCTLVIFDPAGGQLAARLGYSQGRPLPPADLPRPLAVADSPAWAALQRTRQPVLVEAAHLGAPAQLLVPLLRGEAVLGYITLEGAARRRYTAPELELAQALAHQAALAEQFTALAAGARQATLLAERNRLAREMHDTLAQGFTGIVVQLEAAEDVLTADPAAAAAHLDRARGLARSSLAEARRSVWALRPQALEHAPLAAALPAAVLALTAGTPLAVAVDIDPNLPPLAPETEAALLRVAQEAVTNALRHAQARALTVALRAEAGAVLLTVRDDGVGFAPAAAAGPGLGLVGMRERAAQLGGTLTIETAPGQGVAVGLRLPTAAGSVAA